MKAKRPEVPQRVLVVWRWHQFTRDEGAWVFTCTEQGQSKAAALREARGWMGPGVYRAETYTLAKPPRARAGKR